MYPHQRIGYSLASGRGSKIGQGHFPLPGLVVGKVQLQWLATALLARCEHLNLEVGELSAVYTTGFPDILKHCLRKYNFSRKFEKQRKKG